MWGQGVYGAQILVLVHKFTFKVVLRVIFSHRLSLLLNIQIEKSDNFDPQYFKLALPLSQGVNPLGLFKPLVGLFTPEGGLRALRNFSIMRALKALTHSLPKAPTALPHTGVEVTLLLTWGVWQGVPVTDLLETSRTDQIQVIPHLQ